MTLTRAQRRSLHACTTNIDAPVDVVSHDDGTLTVRHEARLWLIDANGATTVLLPLRGDVAA